MSNALHRFSLRVSPKADMAGKYSAEFCARELVRGTPSGPEMRRYTRPTEIGDLLNQLGVHREDVLAALAKFGHEQSIMLTTDLDPDVLQNEGFEAV